MSEENSQKKGKILVFSAPSGAGKTTLLNYLIQKIPNMVYSISATTRQPRPGEENGVHYFFTSEQEFKERIRENKFAEWELVHGNYYGTPREFVDSVTASGKHIIMDIDVYGKKKFDLVYPEAVGFLIVPPSMEELERRLRSRNTDDESVIRTRMANAVKELEFAHKKGRYEYEIVNDDLIRARNHLLELVKKVIDE